jgi:hypothetical protein
MGAVRLPFGAHKKYIRFSNPHELDGHLLRHNDKAIINEWHCIVIARMKNQMKLQETIVKNKPGQVGLQIKNWN